MSRTPQEKRLHMFNLGNDRCPICLTRFAETDVREGETVELEHVPAKSLNAGGFAMCLTCADCNNSTSRMEKVAADMERAPHQGWKAQLIADELPTHTVYLTGDKPIENINEYLNPGETGPIGMRCGTLRVSEEEFSRAFLRPNQSFRLQYSFDPRYASVAWLKAAYLSVFSLLGRFGYRYAKGEAIEQVRHEIMKPGRGTLHHFFFDAPPGWEDENVIAIVRLGRPCWVVKMRDRLVLLPRAWDTSFYEWVESTMNEEHRLALGEASVWYSHGFGEMVVSSISFRQGAVLPNKDDLFGRSGRLCSADRKIPCVIVDRSACHMTILPYWNSTLAINRQRAQELG